MAPRYPRAWVDQVYAASSIVDVVQNYLPLNRQGRRFVGLCPFHHEKTPSFSISPDLNLYHCFGCKASGNVVQFVMEMEKFSYPEALLHLAKQFNVAPPPVLDDNPDEERLRSLRERLYEANKEAAIYFHEFLWTDQGSRALDYLRSRGLDDATIRRFGLGASADDWDGLLLHLTDKGYTQEELQQAALITVRENSRYDTFRDRVMFPIINRYGQTVGFGARALGDAQPKYLNTSETLLFNKRSHLYGINLLRRQRDLKHVYLVEGYLDVITLSQHGFHGAVATLGTAITQEQTRLLRNLAPEVWVAYDGDEAGQSAALRAVDLLNQEGVTCRVMQFPSGEDPDDTIRRHGAEAFGAIKPLASMDFKLLQLEKGFDLSQDDQRRQYAMDACKILHILREPVEVDHYLGKIALKTGIAKDVLAAQLQAGKRGEGAQAVLLQQGTAKSESGHHSQSEFTLVSLLATGLLPEGMVMPDDFEDSALREIVVRFKEGQGPVQIMDGMEDVQARTLAGEIFHRLPQLSREDALIAAEDCLRVMRAQKLSSRIHALTEAMKHQSGEEKVMSLHLIRELQSEQNRQQKR